MISARSEPLAAKPREPKPSIINEKTIADVGYLSSSPDAPKGKA